MPFADLFSVLPPLAVGPGWLQGTLFAATPEISNSVNRWFRRSSSISDNGFWVVIILLIVALWVGLYYWDRSRKPKKRAGLDREGLFLQLCDLHNLSPTDRQMLIDCANSQQLDQPALAFVNPAVLIKHLERHPQSADRGEELLARLFGDALMQEIVRQSAQTQSA